MTSVIVGVILYSLAFSVLLLLMRAKSLGANQKLNVFDDEEQMYALQKGRQVSIKARDGQSF